MTLLSQNKYKLALQEFTDIENDLDERVRCLEHKYDPENDVLKKLLAFSFNNIGCFYKKLNKPIQALAYLEKALEIVSDLPETMEILQIKANIFMNLSSTHSLGSKHDIGLSYCTKAIKILANVYNSILLNRDKEIAEESETEEESEKVYSNYNKSSLLRANKAKNDSQLSKDDEKVITSLIIAYYNCGVEFNHMNDRQEALKFYKIAFDLSCKELGTNSYL